MLMLHWRKDKALLNGTAITETITGLFIQQMFIGFMGYPGRSPIRQQISLWNKDRLFIPFFPKRKGRDKIMNR